MRWLAVMIMTGVGCGMVGCETHVVIEQPKPMQINVNLSGQVDIVIHDAREDLRQINGEPTNVVSPADIGLPAKAPTTGPAAQARLADGAVLYLEAQAARPMAGTAGVEDLKKAMGTRSAALQNLWTGAGHQIGEGHNGMVAARGTLTASQQALVYAENKDRAALYAAEAAQRKMSVDDVALGYYVARLGYIKTGAWYEKFNQASNTWEWQQWSK